MAPDTHDDAPDDALPPSPSAGAAPDPGATRAGFVALIGAPNAGKSTLINQLVGAKVSIVTHKVQTTRALVRGIAMKDNAQVIFVDTPGIFKPRRRLDRAMVTTAWGGAADADLVALLVDARKGVDEEVEAVLQRLTDVRQPKVLILNKIDVVKRDTLLALTADLNARGNFEATFMVSALNGDRVDDVLSYFAKRVPAGPWLYPEDEISDAPLRMLAAEITREKLLMRLHEEIPYESTVETEVWKDIGKDRVRIEQTIFVARDSQKKIVLGAKGQAIKAISMAARVELAELLEKRVDLFLFVKVRENWADDPERYREMGIEMPKA